MDQEKKLRSLGYRSLRGNSSEEDEEQGSGAKKRGGKAKAGAGRKGQDSVSKKPIL